MKAITLWQPWASLLACDAKKFETRSWATSYRGPIVIHAAQRPFDMDKYLFDRELHLFAEALQLPDIYSFSTLPLGSIVACAELVGCWEIAADPLGPFICRPHMADGKTFEHVVTGNEVLFGDWTPGRYAWEFANMNMLPEPIPAKGKQGLWNWEGVAS